MKNQRFDRQLDLFGAAGQAKLRVANVTVVGIGGVGGIIVQNLALLGVGGISLIDDQQLEETNRNRHVCAWHDDPVPDTDKVDIAKRMIELIDSSVKVQAVHEELISKDGFNAVKQADFVFGCVDSEGARLVLTELCAAFEKPYIDVASDVIPGEPTQYGGRVFCSVDGNGCLSCLGLIDMSEAREDFETPEQRLDRAAIYGISNDKLNRSGPSVVTINTVVAGLAATEFMKLCTGLDKPTRIIKYDGRLSRITVSVDEPRPDCYFCKSVWGSGEGADIERYLRTLKAT